MQKVRKMIATHPSIAKLGKTDQEIVDKLKSLSENTDELKRKLYQVGLDGQEILTRLSQLDNNDKDLSAKFALLGLQQNDFEKRVERMDDRTKQQLNEIQRISEVLSIRLSEMREGFEMTLLTKLDEFNVYNQDWFTMLGENDAEIIKNQIEMMQSHAKVSLFTCFFHHAPIIILDCCFFKDSATFGGDWSQNGRFQNRSRAVRFQIYLH